MPLQNSIEDECKKLISRYFAGLGADHQLQRRYERATGNAAASKKSPAPRHWSAADHFNPFKVRPRASRIAAAIAHRIQDHSYDPHPALVLDIAKPGGGRRQISVSSVADGAVASRLYERILKRNQSRLSPFSYAYREDIGVHDSIERLARKFATRSRFHLVEFDFSKYFDTISHRYLLDVLHRTFKVTRTESAVISAFLHCRRAFEVDAYRSGAFSRPSRGVPQGNSLSLFLANVACHELDLQLADAGYQFARYADDTVLMCDSESQAGKALEIIVDHCATAGLAINFTKSDGITICTPEAIGAAPEVAPRKAPEKSYFDYLGHRFQYRVVHRANHPAAALVRRVSIRPSTEKKLRQKLSGILYSHLLRYPQRNEFKPSRVDPAISVDWDLVTCINDLRGYIYGGMKEDDLRRALNDRTVRLHQSTGVMGFFPLINDVEQLKAIDGWLLHAIEAACASRAKVLRSNFGVKQYPLMTAKTLLAAEWYSSDKAGLRNDVRIPSVLRAWKYARKGLRAFDLRTYPSRGLGLGDEGLYA